MDDYKKEMVVEVQRKAPEHKNYSLYYPNLIYVLLCVTGMIGTPCLDASFTV